jgi:hypothetical protein
MLLSNMLKLTLLTTDLIHHPTLSKLSSHIFSSCFTRSEKNPAQTLFLPSADYEVVALSLKITFGPLSPDFIETGFDYDSYDTFDDQ